MNTAPNEKNKRLLIAKKITGGYQHKQLNVLLQEKNV